MDASGAPGDADAPDASLAPPRKHPKQRHVDSAGVAAVIEALPVADAAPTAGAAPVTGAVEASTHLMPVVQSRSGRGANKRRVDSTTTRDKICIPPVVLKALGGGGWRAVLERAASLVGQHHASPFTLKSRLLRLLEKDVELVSQHLVRPDGTIGVSTIVLLLLHVARHVHSNSYIPNKEIVHQHVAQCLTVALDIAQAADGCMEAGIVEAIAMGSFGVEQQKRTPVVSIVLRHLDDAIELKEGAAHAALALLKELSRDTHGARALLDVSIPHKGGRRTCFEALKKWQTVPGTVSALLAIGWELLWFDPSGAATSFANVDHGEAIAEVVFTLKSYLRAPSVSSQEVVRNALGVLFHLNPRDVGKRLRAMLLGGSVQSAEEVTCLLDAVFAFIGGSLASYETKSLPSLVAAMQVARDLVPSVLPLVSRQSQLQHLRRLRNFMEQCAAIPELEPQMMPLCKALVDAYTADGSSRVSAQVASISSMPLPSVAVAS